MYIYVHRARPTGLSIAALTLLLLLAGATVLASCSFGPGSCSSPYHLSPVQAKRVLGCAPPAPTATPVAPRSTSAPGASAPLAGG